MYRVAVFLLWLQQIHEKVSNETLADAAGCHGNGTGLK